MHQYLVGSLEGAVATQSSGSKPKVQVVRRGPSKAETSSTISTLKAIAPQLELAAFVVASVAVVVIARSAMSRTHFTLKSSSGSEGHGGFLSGFLLAAASSATLGALGYRYISKAISFSDFDPSRFPAHMHASKVVTSTNRPAGVLMPHVSNL